MQNKIYEVKLDQQIIQPRLQSTMETNIVYYFKDEIREIIKSNLTGNDYPDFRDKFFNDMWSTWFDLYNHNPNNLEEICIQRICNNSLIRIGCRPILKTQWTEKHLIFVKDLLTDKGTFLTENNLNTRFNIRLRNLEYNSLINANCL
jgi:hypothetical protein